MYIESALSESSNSLKQWNKKVFYELLGEQIDK